MITNLEIATVMGIRTDRFMDIDVDVSMSIRSQIAPNQFLLGVKLMTNLVQKMTKLDAKMVQHDAKMGFRTAC